MKKTFLVAVLFSVAPLAWGGPAPVGGAAGASSAAIFQALAGQSGQSLFAVAQLVFGSSPNPNGSITSPVIFIDGIGNATITITPDGEVTVTPVR